MLDKMLKGKYVSEQRFLIEGSIIRSGETIHHSVAFNDIVISRGGGSGMIDLRVHVDGHFMYQQRSDGLIISTPTGSTAYSLSAGGPMLHPNLAGIVLVSIAPHTLSNRPIVIPDTSEIVVEVVEANQPSINFDSQSFASLRVSDRIFIKRSADTITFCIPWDGVITIPCATSCTGTRFHDGKRWIETGAPAVRTVGNIMNHWG